VTGDGNDRWKTLQSLFTAALENPPGEREAFLRARCDSDEELLADVLRLLHAHDDSKDLLEPAVAFGDDSPPAERETGSSAGDCFLPDRIGPYEPVRLIAEGGMGAVYEAVQENPRRTVAVKIIRPTFITRGLLQRFEHEAHVLGRLQHPGIAQIHEAGTTEINGRTVPFFAMEFVSGSAVVDYADEAGLGLRERLDLLARILDAIEHAHQRGVVHRDLKPANILVTGDGQPKVLDFGVARTIEGDVQAVTMQTGTGQIIGTLPYMSPEQASGDPVQIDTRSDVYALGVIGYELLTRSLPLDVRRKTITDAVRIIQEEEPTRLGSIDRSCRGDVETIFAKALDKDKERRYPTAAAFGADIRRYLNDEPVEARPPSMTYQLRKFARRNKAIVGGAAAVFLVAVAGAVIAGVLAVQRGEALVAVTDAKKDLEEALAFTEQARADADQARIEAELARDEAEAVNEFLNDDLLRSVDIMKNPTNRDILMRDAVRRAADRFDARRSAVPIVEAAIRYSLGRSFDSLGEYQDAADQLEKSTTILRDTLGARHRKTLESMCRLAASYENLGSSNEGNDLYEEGLAICREVFGNDDQLTLEFMAGLAMSEQTAGAMDRSLQLYEECLDILTRVVGEDHELHYATLQGISVNHLNRGQLEKAEEFSLMAIQVADRIFEEEDYSRLMAHSQRATIFHRMKRFDEAFEIYQEIVPTVRRLYGETHRSTLFLTVRQAGLLRQLGRLAEAELLFAEALAAQENEFGPDHLDTLSTRNSLALLYKAMGRLDEAEEMTGKVLLTCERLFGREHHDTLIVLTNLAVLHQQLERFDSAEEMFHRAVDAYEKKLGSENTLTIFALQRLGLLYSKIHRYDLAEPVWIRLVDLTDKVLGQNHYRTRLARISLGRVRGGLGFHDEAETILLDEVERSAAALGENHVTTIWCRLELVKIYLVKEEFAPAVVEARRVLDNARSALAPGHELIGIASLRYGMALSLAGKDPEGAEKALLDAYRIFTGQRVPSRSDILTTVDELIAFYKKRSRVEELKKWEAERSKHIEPKHDS